MTDFVINWNKEAKAASEIAYAEAMQFATFGNELADYVPQHIATDQGPLVNSSSRTEYRKKWISEAFKEYANSNVEKVWTSIDGEDFSNNG